MKKILSIAMAAMMALSLAACGSSSSSGSGAAAPETTKAELNIGAATGNKAVTDNGVVETTTAAEKVIDETKKKELVIGTDVEPDAQVPFDPDLGFSNNENIMTCNIYEGAYALTHDGGVTPLLATGYEVNDDRTVWTIHLRDDVYFSNGDHLTAEDAAWSYNEFANHKSTKSMWGGSGAFVGAEALDDYTVQVTLNTPYIPLLISGFASRAGLILDKKYYDEVGLEAYKENPVGSGPYMLTEVKIKEKQVYEKNPNYWDKNVNVFYEKMTLRFLTDQNTQMLALENGEIDVLYNAKLPPLLKLPKDSGISFTMSEAAGPMVLYFNETGDVPTKDANIRKAIASCVDREALSTVIYDGYATPAYYHGCSFFTDAPKDEDITVKPVEYDLEAAKKYLEAAGYNGENIVLIVASGSMMEQAAQVIQGELMKVGINCELKSLDNASVQAAMKLPDGYSMWIHRANSSAIDFSWERNFLSQRYKAKTSPDSFNQWIYNEEFEDLLDATDFQFDHDERSKTFAKMQDILNEEVRCIPLINTYNITAYHDYVQGVEGCPIEYLIQWKEWY